MFSVSTQYLSGYAFSCFISSFINSLGGSYKYYKYLLKINKCLIFELDFLLITLIDVIQSKI